MLLDIMPPVLQQARLNKANHGGNPSQEPAGSGSSAEP